MYLRLTWYRQKKQMETGHREIEEQVRQSRQLTKSALIGVIG